MTADFQVVAAPFDRFAPLFALSDADLDALGARRVAVDQHPGFPCRVGLVDAGIGETVILTSFTHHDVDSPYRASGPVFVRESAREARPRVNEIPVMLRHRLLSIRAYDAGGIMIGAQVAEGRELEQHIARLFEDEAVTYLHLHNAGPGCFNCRVQRAAQRPR